MPATVIVGAQWGDEGKGKIVDLLALDSDLVCRYQGGPNAGHTIVVGQETFKIRQIPSGVIRGKTCIIGAGCVLDPEVFLGEVDALESRGYSTADVHVSGETHLIMPWHVALDQASERRLGKLQIGTTRRGIGPCYADKAARLGIRVQDVLDAKILRQKIEVALAEKNVWLERVYGAEPLELDELAERYEAYAQRLRSYVADTSLLVDRALRDGQEVLLEGGQGTLLDLDHGTYPFVTSSNTVAPNAATGVGIGANRIERVIGVAKAYVTRVGEGPFPTEIEGPDQLRVQQLGGEFGTVTGPDAPLRLARSRRTPLRGPPQRHHVARADQARRALRLRRDPCLRRVPLAGRQRDGRVPSAPERLPPLPPGLRDAARLGGADRRRAAGRRARVRRVRRAGARRRDLARRNRRRARARRRAALGQAAARTADRHCP